MAPFSTPWTHQKTVKTQLWTYFTPCYSVSIVNFEHVIAGWVGSSLYSGGITMEYWSEMDEVLSLQENLGSRLPWHFAMFQKMFRGS